MEYAKRRRVDNDYSQFGNQQPTTARTSTKQQQQHRNTTQDGNKSNQNRKDDNIVSAPIFSLSSLPPASLQRYLSRYELLETQGTLSYHHAVFPVPPLPSALTPPINGRSLASRRSRPNYGVINHQEEGDGEGTERTGEKRTWKEPKTVEFAELTACDSPDLVVERLAARAKVHWDKKDSVKEGETLTNFLFALRMRAHTLRATPPG